MQPNHVLILTGVLVAVALVPPPMPQLILPIASPSAGGETGTLLISSDVIELTSEQEAAMDQIAADVNAQIRAILTSDQLEQLQQALKSGETFQTAFAALDLSQQQQAVLVTIFRSADSQIQQLLSPDRQQLPSRLNQTPTRSSAIQVSFNTETL